MKVNGVLGRALSDRQATRFYLIGSSAVLALYAALAAVLLATATWTPNGPASLSRAGSKVPSDIVTAAKSVDSFGGTAIVGAEDPSAPGGPVWVVYGIQDGAVYTARAIDANTHLEVQDYSRLKGTGAWQYLGLVKSPGEWIFGGAALIAIVFSTYRWGLFRMVRPVMAERRPVSSPAGRFLSNSVVMTALLVAFVGFFVLPFAPGWNRERKLMWAYRAGAGWALLFLSVALATAYGHGDPESVAATTVIALAGAGAWVYGWVVLSSIGAHRLPELQARRTPPASTPIVAAPAAATVGNPIGDSLTTPALRQSSTAPSPTSIGASAPTSTAAPMEMPAPSVFQANTGSVGTSTSDPMARQPAAGTWAPDPAVASLAGGFIALSLILRFITGGWYLLFFGLAYLAVCGIHFGVHWFAATRLRRGVTNLVAVLCSNLVLLFAFLLQEDASDVGPPWVTITALLRGGTEGAAPPRWFESSLPQLGFGSSLPQLAVIPLAASWLVLMALSMPIGSRTAKVAVRICGVAVLGGLVALLLAVLVAVVVSPPGSYSY